MYTSIDKIDIEIKNYIVAINIRYKSCFEQQNGKDIYMSDSAGIFLYVNGQTEMSKSKQ